MKCIFTWVVRLFKSCLKFHGHFTHIRSASVWLRDCGNFSDREILFFSNDEHNAMVVMVLLERHGVRVQWATSETIGSCLPKFSCGIILYDIPDVDWSANLNHRRSYFDQVNNLPHSAVLVGFGKSEDIPIVFASVCSRTVALLSKPFDVVNALNIFECLVVIQSVHKLSDVGTRRRGAVVKKLHLVVCSVFRSFWIFIRYHLDLQFQIVLRGGREI